MRVLKFFTISFCLALSLSCNKEDKYKYASSVSEALSANKDSYKFTKAYKPINFSFPKDHGAHNDFQNEWWYYTGNLKDKNNNRYGYQLTFFRRNLDPDLKSAKSDWRANQLYSVHFTVTDVKNDKFYFTERYSRGSAGLAGVNASPYKVWLEDLKAEQIGEYTFINAKNSPVNINLKLKPIKPIVLQGNKGLSQKSGEAGNASYYYSMTRMETEGKFIINNEEFQVEGLSWLDREWSTSALSKNQIGWDWFSLQFDDNRELMLYNLRLKNGDIDPFSSGSYIDPSGKVFPLTKDDFKIESTSTWISPETKSKYPSKWKVEVPKYKLSFEVTPHQNNQELLNSFIYWEGAVKISGENISGNGYVELTGYNEAKND